MRGRETRGKSESKFRRWRRQGQNYPFPIHIGAYNASVRGRRLTPLRLANEIHDQRRGWDEHQHEEASNPDRAGRHDKVTSKKVRDKIGDDQCRRNSQSRKPNEQRDADRGVVVSRRVAVHVTSVATNDAGEVSESYRRVPASARRSYPTIAVRFPWEGLG